MAANEEKKTQRQRTPLDRSLMTVASEAKQCGVASTLIEQVRFDGVIGVLFWGEAVGT